MHLNPLGYNLKLFLVTTINDLRNSLFLGFFFLKLALWFGRFFCSFYSGLLFFNLNILSYFNLLLHIMHLSSDHSRSSSEFILVSSHAWLSLKGSVQNWMEYSS